MRHLVITLALLATSTLASPTGVQPFETSPEINEYIDRTVQEVKKLIVEQSLEPAGLPNLVRDFEYTDIFGITYTGNASVTDGSLAGQVTILRFGDVDMSYGTFVLHVAGRLGFMRIMMDYKFVADIMDLGPEGQAICFVKDTTMDFQYDMDFRTLQSNITYFAVSSVGHTNCEIRGLGALNWLAEAFVNLFIDIFEDTILGLMSAKIEELLQQALDNIGGYTTAPPQLGAGVTLPQQPYEALRYRDSAHLLRH